MACDGKIRARADRGSFPLAREPLGFRLPPCGPLTLRPRRLPPSALPQPRSYAAENDSDDKRTEQIEIKG
jgi:hypothetical protein